MPLDAGSKLLILWRNRMLVDGRTRTPFLVGFERVRDAGEAIAFAPNDDAAQGDDPNVPRGFFVLDPANDGMAQLDDEPGVALRFIDPMFELARGTKPLRGALVRALAIARWSEATRFCSQCGLGLAWEVPGRVKMCANAEPHRHWPRIDPSAIMLVSDGERMLLGRQPTWPPGMYSTLAGFVDRGESVEDAVVREVFEEAGVRVGRVTYFGSEPWPFPRSLMLGFFAEALTTDIVRGDELEDVRWFTYDEGRELERSLAARAPFADTIARRLIATWLRERSAREQLA